MAFLGIDTSNYTTSAALFFPEDKRVVQYKKLLPVKSGDKGLRQSDAVFHHTQQLPGLIEELFTENKTAVTGIGVSDRPCSFEGSYMPCFTVGTAAARMLSASSGCRLNTFSHQQGHIAAVLFSAGRLELLSERFIAFHVSGGTTQAVLVSPGGEGFFSCKIIAQSLDLKAGQAVDRTGLMLGLDFPCGAELDRLAVKSNREFRIRPSMKGTDCSLSGVENKCRQMLSAGESREDIARFCVEYISAALESMAKGLLSEYGELPLVFSGGVMSNSIISDWFTRRYGAVFGQPQFSSDNAAGVAVLASMI